MSSLAFGHTLAPQWQPDSLEPTFARIVKKLWDALRQTESDAKRQFLPTLRQTLPSARKVASGLLRTDGELHRPIAFTARFPHLTHLSHLSRAATFRAALNVQSGNLAIKGDVIHTPECSACRPNIGATGLK